MKKILGGLIVGVFVAVTAGTALAKPPKVQVCHYDDDGIPSAPKTLSVGDAKAAAKHVQNHTIANGHEGNDTLGACIPG